MHNLMKMKIKIIAHVAAIHVLTLEWTALKLQTEQDCAFDHTEQHSVLYV